MRKAAIFLKKPVIWVLILGLLLRLSLSGLAFHDDLIVNASWGNWIYTYGPMHFYSNTTWPYSWPTQPPLINLVYGFNFFLYDKILLLLSSISFFIAVHRIFPTHFLWFFDFVKWFGTAKYQITTFRIGELITMKLPAILADLVISFLIYRLAKPKWGERAIRWMMLYLFLPFSFYLSSLWGQYDQFSFLFLFLSCMLLFKKEFFLSPIFLLISIETKPTSLIFIPLFLFIYFKQKPPLKTVLLSLVSGLILFILSAWVFSDINLIQFIFQQLPQKIFGKSEFRISTNAFNFWRIFIGEKAMNDATILFLLPTKIWGYGIYILLNIIAFSISKKITPEKLFTSFFVVGVGSWLFLTNMLDRYLFAGVIFGLIVTIYRPAFLKYWLIIAVIFGVNLYNQWFYPDTFLKELLIWNEEFLTRMLGVVNVVVYFRMSWIVLEDKKSISKFSIERPWNRLSRFLLSQE